MSDPRQAKAIRTKHPHLENLRQRAAKQGGAIRVAVAYPCDAGTLQSCLQAAALGLIEPVLVGPRLRIEAAATQAGLSLAGLPLHECADDPLQAALLAAALCRDGVCAALMKGSLHSDDLLTAALASESGLRTQRRASHVFVIDVPGVNRPLLFTDCVVNIAPTLMDKLDIAQNALNLAEALGIDQAHVAVLSAVETVTPTIASTVDAAALCKMAERGQIRGGIVDGPLAYDNAISLESAQNKGISSQVAGKPDILLVPNLEAGNMLYKQLVYMALADCAGIVLGMKVPIILTSRSDSVESRIASCSLAKLMCLHARPH
jgi:phosphate acetyltransferase